MKIALSLLILSSLVFVGCRTRKFGESETEAAVKPFHLKTPEPMPLPVLTIKNSTILKMLATPELTRALKTGVTLDKPENFSCLLYQGTRVSLMEKMTKQLFHKRGKVTAKHYLVKIENVDNPSLSLAISEQSKHMLSENAKKILLPCSQFKTFPLVGYIESDDVLVNGITNDQVAYDSDLGAKYTASSYILGSDKKGFQPLTGDCWRDVSYAIPRAVGQLDSVFPNIENDAGKSMSVLANGPAFLAWAKASPDRLCELFGLEISPDKSLAKAPLGSTLIYHYSDKTNFDDKKNPVCTFSEKHGHIEIRLTDEGKESIFCSDGCWKWAKGHFGARANCSEASAVLYPSLRCPISASKPK